MIFYFNIFLIRFDYDKNFNADNEVLYGLYDTIEKMISDKRN